MARSRLVPIDDESAWCDVLARCQEYDSYHLPGYHRVVTRDTQEEPWLFAFEDAGRWAAIPFLKRPVCQAEGLHDCNVWDAVSAYGYPGAITSVDRRAPEAADFRRAFGASLRESLADLGVVTLLIRQNPLIDTSWLLAEVAEIVEQGPTVAMDLRLSEEEQLSRMRRVHRYDVRCGRRDGITVADDPDFRRLEEFVQIYWETMDRIGASPGYYFPRSYFTDLKEQLGDRLKILFADLGGETVAAGMFLLTGHIVQYHLSGRTAKHLRIPSGVKIILDEMRVRGSRAGFSWLHLGGGVGAQRDQLFDFKAGFSDAHFTFQTGRIVVQPEVYHDLVRTRRQWLDGQQATIADHRFFPEYRCPPARKAA